MTFEGQLRLPLCTLKQVGEEEVPLKVALFIDGKNFYKGMYDYDPSLQIDYELLSQWIVRHAGGPGSVFVGAYYYTGLSNIVGDAVNLRKFLEQLEHRKGYFVRREPRVTRKSRCRHCDQVTEYKTEKRVDSRLVAEMIQLAAVNAFDMAVLLSGDQDLVPAVEALGALGKQVYVGTWRGRGLSKELRIRCFGGIDLSEGVNEFCLTKIQAQRPGGSVTGRRVPIGVPSSPIPVPNPLAVPPVKNLSTKPASLAQSVAAAVDPAQAPAVAAAPAAVPAAHQCSPQDLENTLREIQAALKKFDDGFLGRWYFVNMWKGVLPMPNTGEARDSAVTQLISTGKIEQYRTTDKKSRPTDALRLPPSK